MVVDKALRTNGPWAHNNRRSIRLDKAENNMVGESLTDDPACLRSSLHAQVQAALIFACQATALSESFISQM